MTAKRIGRPPVWTDDKRKTAQQEICERIADGESLRGICKSEGMPHYCTALQWLKEEPGFASQYAHAREDQADAYADEIIAIADTEEDAAKARVRVDARKWVASKLKPKKYGDKLDLNHSGSIEQLSDEEVDRRIARALAELQASEAGN
jgi:hypothetical protein